MTEKRLQNGGIYRAGDLHPGRRRREIQLGGRKPPLIDRLTHMEQYEAITSIMKPFLGLTGLMERGRRNAEAVVLKPLPLTFHNLPPTFAGFTILFLTDMHFDGNPALTQAITRAVEGVEVDICLLGGDFRYGMYQTGKRAVEQTGEVISGIRAREGIFGILGNHDSWSLLAPLEALGLRMLVNEAVSFTRDGQRIWIAGVDDPHFFRAADFSAAMTGVPDGAFCAALCHSPEGMADAAANGADLFLCGHTHAGQIRLPLVGALSQHSPLPRRFNAGPWRYNGMQGYTSYGVGSSGLFVRFNCPPEVVLITLNRAA